MHYAYIDTSGLSQDGEGSMFQFMKHFAFWGIFFDNSMAFTSNAFPIITTRGSTSAVGSTDILLQLKII